MLAVLSAVLLIIFGGVTDRLIPLFAVGAFLAFTLSQAGMVAHWRKNNGSWYHVLVNGIGAAATGVTVLVVVAAKFTQGAWIVVLLLPAAILLMARVRRHYRVVTRETEAKGRLLRDNNHHPPIVIVPIERWNSSTQKTLRFAMTLSPEVLCRARSVRRRRQYRRGMGEYGRTTGARCGSPGSAPDHLALALPMVLQPVVDYVLQVEKENRHRTIAVVISTMVERHWYHYFLHNQRSEVLTAMLLLGGDRRINIINVPWYLKA